MLAQVAELLSEATVAPAAEGAVVELGRRVAKLVKGLPEAQLPKFAAKGFLRDLGFALKVRAMVLFSSRAGSEWRHQKGGPHHPAPTDRPLR